ncbi:hypothetical protein D3C71_1969630 [compost metagenome]
MERTSKSLVTLYGRFFRRSGLIDRGVFGVNRMVYPSGAALATACVPMMAFAPPLFCTTTGVFMMTVNSSAMRRAMVSAMPPALYGTTI